MPSTSPGRRARVVAETVASSCEKRGRSAAISVPLPAPDGPVTTKTGRRLPVEEANQLRPLAIRQAADGLRLTDPALVEEAGGLDAPELRHCHEHVEDLGGRDPLRRIAEDLLDSHR